MLELRTLGTIDLRGDDGGRVGSVLLHSKRVALLAYLCASRAGRLHRRDTLAALLWPEVDATHARGALRHELWELRRALGPGVVRGEGSEAIGVEGDRIWCDVQAFESSLDEGRPGDALAFWHGEFLPGLHVSGGEFERWLDDERNRLARRATDAARQLVARADGIGDAAGAISWARRLTELAPYDEAGWQCLMVTLDRAGDRAGALAVYEALAMRLREELDVEPSPETQALSRQIRERRETVGNSSGGPPASPARGSHTVDRGADGQTRTVVHLVPVENLTGDAALDPLARRLTDWLAHGLSRLPYLRLSVGGRGTSHGAVVSAVLYRQCGRIEVRGRLEESGDAGRVLAVPEAAVLSPEPTDVVMESVVERVLAAVHAHCSPDATGATDGMPFQIPSWKSFQEGTLGAELFGDLRFHEAAEHLRCAYELDSTFVNAGIFVGIALMHAGEPAAAESFVTRVMAERAPLPRYERFFGEWLLADLRGRRTEAYRAAVESSRASGHPVSRLVAAREALRMNRPRETLEMFQSIQMQQGWWSKWTEPWEGVAGALHMLGEHEKELGAVIGGRARFPDSLELIRAEVRARAALGAFDQALVLVGEALTLPPAPTSSVPPTRITPAHVAWVAAQEMEHHGDSECATETRRIALRWLEQRKDATRPQRLLQLRLLLESGRSAEARDRLVGVAPPADPESLGLLGLVAATGGDPVTAENALAALGDIDDPYVCGRHLLHAAGIEAALDRRDAAMDTLRRAFAAGLPFGVEFHALPFLRPLVGRKDFAELLAPRG